MEKLKLDFYYGREAEQFTFYRLPKALITDARFKGITNNAKLLYEKARDWYEKEAVEQTWSVRTLQRNISSQYYYRMLKTQKKELVESEMKNLTAALYNTPVMMQGYYHAEVNHTMPEYAELEQCRNELGFSCNLYQI